MALVLTCNPGGRIHIGDSIVVTVEHSTDFTDQIKVLVDAPQSIPVHREKIYKQIQAKKKRTATLKNGFRERPVMQKWKSIKQQQVK